MPGSDRLPAAFDKQLTELIERWKRQKKKERKESRAERGGVELCPCVLLPRFYMVDLYFSARMYWCCHMCVCTCLCFFMCSCVFAYQVAMLLKKRWSGDALCFCVFPSTYLLSLIIARQRNELGGIGLTSTKPGLTVLSTDIEWAANKILTETLGSPLRCLHFCVVQSELVSTCSNTWVLLIYSISCNLSAQRCRDY